MVLPGEPPAWQFTMAETYVPLSYEDEVVGFCKPDFAARIVDALNDNEKLYKALRLACYDLVGRSGGGEVQLDLLMEQYLTKTAFPTSGVAAIAVLLRDRQDELDVTDKEFIRFCDSYRLPKEKLQAIYDGEEIDSEDLGPLSRILGRSVDDLMQVLEGSV
ncbi:hypothetical protein H6G89_28045 [Oscillatoria sp. FACHB-1407]|uniref:hypothetical protein n=1 Tax=Oscillatoria sp. FACHB-1407 TaxID=2692847 RepID=UPI0016858B30|nr:hypothetical protein [Oscillatoria sp. FACHB-1407]MBD2464859.1 hypothetical protein [Oscillatoria sp. FACHB-1407]